MNTGMPIISLVVPVYNAGDFLEETLQSLVHQTFKNFEVIAVDDGSTDHSFSILNKYADRMRVIQQPNSGQAAAMNHGWSIAKGKFLGYLSADDRLKPNAIERLVAAIESNPSAIAIYPDYELIDESGRAFKSVQAPDFDYARVVSELLCPPGPGIIFRREIFERFGGWRSDLRQMPDYEYWLRVGGQGEFVHLREVLAEFRVHSGSQTYAASSIEKSEEPVKILDGFFKNEKLPPSIKNLNAKSHAYACLLSARLHWRSCRYSVALNRLAQALHSWPAIVVQMRAMGLIGNAVLGGVTYRARQLLSRSR